MRKWFAFALVVICVVLVAAVRVGPRFTPMQPNPDIPTFRQVSGQGSSQDPEVTKDQSTYRPRQLNCAFPGYPDGAKIVVLSAGRGQAISSASLGGQDVSTTVISVRVEAGEQPLYVIATASSAVVWRLSGATARIRHLVLSSTHLVTSTQWGERIPMGETGVPRDNVTFLADAGCVPVFGKPSWGGGPPAARAVVKGGVGHEPDMLTGNEVAAAFSIPSGELTVTGMGDSERGRELEKEHLFALLNPDPMAGHPLDYEVAQTYPDGVMKIGADDVIANVPVENYETWPGKAGLKQLVERGALQQVNTDLYRILGPIRMPAELSGAHFTLMKGVPRPEGRYRGACVVDQDTGQSIRSSADNAALLGPMPC